MSRNLLWFEVARRKALVGNLRKNVRYAISAPTTFSWGDDPERACGEGVTRDVSLHSSFLWSESCPPEGVSLECQIFLPRVGPRSRELKAIVEGVVGRIDAPSPEHGVRGFVVMHRHLKIVETDRDALEESGLSVATDDGTEN